MIGDGVVTIMVGDCLRRLQEIPDNSIHCCITSPPYWGLRSYKGGPDMIGLEQSFDEHLENLVSVFREVRRVLRKDGVLFLNYGDAYWGGKGQSNFAYAASHTDRNTLQKSYHHVAGEIGQTRPTDGKHPIFKPKDLMMMPSLVAMALRDDGAADVRAMRTIERIGYELADEYRAADEEIPGPVRRVLDKLAEEYAQAKGDSWWLRSEIIWQKPNPMPESVTDRPTSAHEKLFLLSKSAKYFYDAEAVRSDYKQAQHGEGLTAWATSSGHHGQDPRDKPRPGAQRWENGSKGTGANLRNVWTIPTHSFSEAHFATFPPKLVEPCIKAGTSEKGCCAKCGSPWVRRTEKRDTGTMTKKPDGWATGDGSHGTVHRDGREAGKTMEVTCTVSTGWLPTCDHDADPVPCVCLDPFAGAGTVGLVALQLGRSAKLIELSSEYVEMARVRIKKSMGMFSRVKVV